MNGRSRLPVALRVLIACVALAAIGTATAAAEKRVQFNIAAQDLLTALNQFAQQSDRELLFSTDVAASKRTGGVTGELPPTEALHALLEGTGLGYRVTSENTILIERMGGGASDRRDEKTSTVFRTPFALAQATPASQRERDDTKSAKNGSSAASEERAEERLGEMTVTGSHLRGVQSASPLLVFDQTDFDRAGAATAQQFLATLPQNFGGGQTDDTSVNEGPVNQANVSFGTAVNLRGLGPSSTLVLINGRRSAAGGTAEFVDISMIPLSAVERIEVLPDGASAIYGSDAIGGVVNFIMRQDYEGAETRLRGGMTTHGDAGEYQASQSLGTGWDSGSTLFSYEYYRREALNSVERDFSASALGPLDLVPYQRKHSAYLSAQQRFAEHLRISGDAFYTDRKGNYTGWDQSLLEVQHTKPDTTQYGGSLGARLDFGNTWGIEIAGDTSRNKVDALITSPTQFGGFGDLRFDSEFALASADVKLEGDLFDMNQSAVKLAIGGSYREESYTFSQETVDGAVVLPRSKYSTSTRAAFAEMSIPIVGGSAITPQTARLNLTLAGRYEDYSDFGTTFDPKFGIRWTPLDALSLRATYGTSFKAPNAFQLNNFNGSYGIRSRPDSQSPTGTTRALSLVGNSPDLSEETATTWTAGAELAPGFLPGFRAEITYFDIEYKDRIQEVLLPINTVFNDPTYASLVTRRGDIPDSEFDALVARFLAGPIPVSGCAVPLDPNTKACPEPVSNINAVIDRRLSNLAGTRTSGVDLALNQRIDSDVGTVDLNINTSYLFDYQQQVAETVPSVEFVNTGHNPIDFRVRASATWSKSGWGVTATVNYADDYRDTVSAPVADIKSLTTVDLNLRYDAAHQFDSTWLDDTVFSLTVLNLLDEDPPFLADQFWGLGYDPSNAEPFGRAISLNVLKSW